MKLPKYFTTITPISTAFALILFVALPIIAYYLGTQNQDKKELINKDAQIQQLKKQLDEKEEEIQLAIENRGKVQKTFESTYNFDDYGIYSPLFEWKKVQNTVYQYKGNTITAKTILVAEDKGTRISETKVTVWEFEKSKKYGYSSDPQENFATFDGYENYGVRPNYLTDIMAKWKDSYTNKNGIKMYWSYSGGPKGDVVHAVYLEFYQRYTPDGNPILVKLSVDNQYAIGTTDPVLNPVREKLKQLADTVSERKLR